MKVRWQNIVLPKSLVAWMYATIKSLVVEASPGKPYLTPLAKRAYQECAAITRLLPAIKASQLRLNFKIFRSKLTTPALVAAFQGKSVTT